MKGVEVCQLCKEPIANFACLGCLGESIAGWLPEGYRASFESENRRFLGTFRHSHRGLHHHLICSSGYDVVCLYCYVNEVSQWLDSADRAVARRFRKLFSFGMKKEDFREIIISHAEPITQNMPGRIEFGVCDSCGEYSDSLSERGMEWVCESCME